MPVTQPDETPFRSVAVIGPGLLGGSVALAIRDLLPSCELRLWARRESSLELAREMQITPKLYSDLGAAVSGAELIILATPIGAFEDLTRRMLPQLSPQSLVTDLGSVKAYVHRTTGAFLAERGRDFIGSHPMAGSEKQGLEHASTALLAGATCALCNDHQVSEEKMQRLERFWQAIGMKSYRMEPINHDRSVARISHIPHVLAALCARTADMGGVPKEDLRRLAAGGFRDTTRVSSGPAHMWSDILWENDVAIRDTLNYCIEDLHKLIELLEQGDRAGTEQWLAQGKASRECIRKGKR